jgi:hypothetical protein
MLRKLKVKDLLSTSTYNSMHPQASPYVVCCCCFGCRAYQHCSHEGLLYSNPPMEFRHSSPEALHTKRRERPLLAKDGTKAKKFS